MPKKLSTEDFIVKARKVHGDLYDYSKVDYNGVDTKVCIIDTDYGEFWQTPYKHITRKQGNPERGKKKCVETKKKNFTTKNFIEKARKVHGDFYDYSKVEYTGARTKVCIIDPEYGEFWQTPNNHLMGKHSMDRSGTPLKTKEEFIAEAREVHGDLYDYSKIEYKGTDYKVCIIDPEYGEFWQTAKDHLNGRNHPLRGYANISASLTSTTEEFIEKAKKVHSDFYDYSKVLYINSHENVCIIDPEYGEFWQTPDNHLAGKGCPSRAVSGFDPIKPAILYYIKVMNGIAYKIGITNKTVEERFRGDMNYIDILKTWSYPIGFDAQKEERRILNEFKYAKYEGDDLLSNARTAEMFKFDVLGLDTGPQQLEFDLQ